MRLFICPACGSACLYDDDQEVTHIKCISCGKTFCINEMNSQVDNPAHSIINKLFAEIQNVGDNSHLISFIEKLSQSYDVDKRVIVDLANMHLSRSKHQSLPSQEYDFSIIKETEVTLDDVIVGQQKLEKKLDEAMKRNVDMPINISGLEEKELKRQLLSMKAEKEKINNLYQKAKLEIATLKDKLKKYE